MNSPKEIAAAYCAAGEAKVKMPAFRILILAVFAGMFIALAGVGAGIASVSISVPSVAKLTGALLFPAGLSMVIVAGSELFTGNNLLIVPLLSGRITFLQMIKNWIIVYIGNLIGSLIISGLCSVGGVFSLFGGAAAESVVATAAAKVGMSFGKAFVKGILCNFLVCIAVWMAFAAKTVTGKIAAVFFPVMLFVLSGFEHSVANMYYISAGLFVGSADGLTWGAMFVKNLLPVTLGNIVGGAGIVGCGYWSVYLRESKPKSE